MLEKQSHVTQSLKRQGTVAFSCVFFIFLLYYYMPTIPGLREVNLPSSREISTERNIKWTNEHPKFQRMALLSHTNTQKTFIAVTLVHKFISNSTSSHTLTKSDLVVLLILQVLAKKMTVLYKLASGQLSKQSHYDFGLRALKAVLVMAGELKRGSPDLNEVSR